ENLQITRARRGTQEAMPLQSDALPPFVRVERELTLGLTWEVETRVVRLTPAANAAVLEVPLLPGESVTTENVRVENGKALGNMPPKTSQLGWHSVLAERERIALTAPTGLPWVELWRLDAGPIWHIETK